MLTAYARGVNDRLAQLRSSGQWPAMFSLAGVYPVRWTPVDSLAVQGGLTQQLDYTTTPLDYALLSRALGIGRTIRWLSVASAASQQPYDPGPYRPLGITPIGGASTTAAQVTTSAGTAAEVPASVARAAAAALAVSAALPSGGTGGSGASGGSGGSQWADWGQGARPAGSAWAVNGPKVAGGGSMLAGLTPAPGPLPSAWYQVAISAPGYDVSGVSLPGLPGIVVGHNRRIAWSLGPAQDQSALFYVEKTRPGQPGQYFWRGRWRSMRRVRYTIPVRGSRPRQLTVDLTAHGPVLTRAGQAVSVDWTGSAGSPDVAILARLAAAGSFRQFRAALAGWHAPALTFAYADRAGHIGAIAAGYFPVVRHGAPWLPLPGTGADDVTGVIPYAALPHSYDPPGHVIVAAGQRPVTGAYPYYIGTAASGRDPSYGAALVYRFLARRSRLQPAGLAALQTSLVDPVAVRLLPRLLAALRGTHITAAERQAAAELRGWNHSMDAKSAAAAIWATFWPGYVAATFGPWLRSAAARLGRDPAITAAWAGQVGLTGALEHWTLAEPADPAFTPPGGPAGTAASVMRSAFRAAVARLRARLGGAPASWALERLPSGPATAPAAAAAALPVAASAAQIPVLARGAWSASWAAAGQGSAGSAGGGSERTAGTPGSLGWRMVVHLGGSPAATAGRGGIMAEGIYPGGQSENPASPWFWSLADRWNSGGYLLMPPAGAAASGRIRWALRP
jgi:penicillin amidase